MKVVNYATFLKERQQSLTAFLHAALTMDPKVEDGLQVAHGDATFRIFRNAKVI